MNISILRVIDKSTLSFVSKLNKQYFRTVLCMYSMALLYVASVTLGVGHISICDIP